MKKDSWLSFFFFQKHKGVSYTRTYARTLRIHIVWNFIFIKKKKKSDGIPELLVRR